ncbi:MAG: hypothetical protein IJI59_00060, partial [Clostridia bacterium]|nr:hypothetical protein [Clostridia bacterium]
LPPFNGESIEKQPESTGIVKCKKRDFVSLSEVSFSRILKCKQDVIKGCRQIMDGFLPKARLRPRPAIGKAAWRA